MNTDEFVVEAKARITWGEDPASVRGFLTASGMTASDADIAIQELVAERTKELRKRGLISTCAWGTILCACVIFDIYEFSHRASGPSLRQGKAMFYVGFFGIFAIWRLMNGLSDLIKPKSDARLLCDVEE